MKGTTITRARSKVISLADRASLLLLAIGFHFSSERNLDFRFFHFPVQPDPSLASSSLSDFHFRRRGNSDFGFRISMDPSGRISEWGMRVPTGKLHMHGRKKYHSCRCEPFFLTPLRFPGGFSYAFNVRLVFANFSRGESGKYLHSPTNARPWVR